PVPPKSLGPSTTSPPRARTTTSALPSARKPSCRCRREPGPSVPVDVIVLCGVVSPARLGRGVRRGSVLRRGGGEQRLGPLALRGFRVLGDQGPERLPGDLRLLGLEGRPVQ